ncbi:MAG: hypothetical protein BWY47_01157 [Bacteroidetes bacterium ADurb.Bin302]|nr:MAG: hypothetical protein BWY47_01157 [Bacteroidetes bacterium ADurb.Bin302]
MNRMIEIKRGFGSNALKMKKNALLCKILKNNNYYIDSAYLYN